MLIPPGRLTLPAAKEADTSSHEQERLNEKERLVSCCGSLCGDRHRRRARLSRYVVWRNTRGADSQRSGCYAFTTGYDPRLSVSDHLQIDNRFYHSDHRSANQHAPECSVAADQPPSAM